jgi:hypothetical protein
LERKGFATFTDGRYKVTPRGEAIARSGKTVMEALADQGFSEAQKNAALDQGLEGIAIEEGSKTEVRGVILKRSQLLRKIALARFSDVNGSIACRGMRLCGRECLWRRHARADRNPPPEALVSCAVVHRDRSRCLPLSELRQKVESMRR